jgi:hypothetical protein
MTRGAGAGVVSGFNLLQIMAAAAGIIASEFRLMEFMVEDGSGALHVGMARMTGGMEVLG